MPPSFMAFFVPGFPTRCLAPTAPFVCQLWDMANVLNVAHLSSAMSLAPFPKASGSGTSQSAHASTTACGSAAMLSLLLPVLGSSTAVASP